MAFSAPALHRVTRCMRADGFLGEWAEGVEPALRTASELVSCGPAVQRDASQLRLAADAELTARDVVDAQLRAPTLGADLCAGEEGRGRGGSVS